MELGMFIYGQASQDGFLAKYSGKSFRVKGILRISWDISLKYNKMINIILFLDKSCEDVIDASFEGNYYPDEYQFQYSWPITSPYPNDEKNYRLTEELLGKDKFKTFFSTRFGCRRVGVEGTIFNFDHTDINPETNPYNQSLIESEVPNRMVSSLFLEFDFPDYTGIPTASLKDFKIIDISSVVLAEKDELTPNPHYPSNELESQCYTSNGAFVLTSTKDMYVNMRDKPSSKDGKIIEQLIVQRILYDIPENLNFCQIENLWPKYQKEVDKYILSHKEMMKPSSYTIFAHDILPGDWCKVSLYRFQGEDNRMHDRMLFDAKYPKDRNICETMNEEPSTITLSKGYIHASQLSAFSICSANSVKRK